MAKQHEINRKRTNDIAKGLKAAGFDYPLDPKSSLIDALTNLRHLADKHGLDFGACDRVAYDHYLLEMGLNSLRAAPVRLSASQETLLRNIVRRGVVRSGERNRQMVALEKKGLVERGVPAIVGPNINWFPTQAGLELSGG